MEAGDGEYHKDCGQEEQQGCYIGIDVGTQSARAGLVTSSGHVLASATHPLQIWNPGPDLYIQSTQDIWAACCHCVQALKQNYDLSSVRGIGFDATCSLVVLGESSEPLSVNPAGGSGENLEEQNVIMWMDHRAKKQAAMINATGHHLLQYVGQVISPEMEPPKLLWIKQNMPGTWQKARHFFDLPDFLTWRATGSLTRSLCSLTCKWLYSSADLKGWDSSFWQQIGLPELTEGDCSKIGSKAQAPGDPCGAGLTPEAAQELGLHAGIAVGASLIDADAGALGMLGCKVPVSSDLSSRLVMVSGTSTCHMLLNRIKIITPGVWGPYFSALLPSYWLTEAGQSAAGSLIQHLIATHPAYPQIRAEAEAKKSHVQAVLNELLEEMKVGGASISHLTSKLHVWPDFHGNRSPLADPTLRGMVSGLNLSSKTEDLALLYLATLQALAYSTRHIVESLTRSGHKVSTLLLCGGLAKNPLYVQLHADVTGLPVVLSEEKEPVLLGAAMLAAKATGDFPSLESTLQRMGSTGKVAQPSPADTGFHERKYQVFLRLLECQLDCRKIMSSQ